MEGNGDMGSHITRAAEANSFVISAIKGLLAPDFREARGRKDLKSRLASKGFQIREGYLATAPHGKLICPVSEF